MLKTEGKLAPEAKPKMINLLFQAFFVYSLVTYTIFPHPFSEKWHLRQDRRKGMYHFRLGYMCMGKKAGPFFGPVFSKIFFLGPHLQNPLFLVLKDVGSMRKIVTQLK